MSVLQGMVSNGGYLYAAWKGEPDDDRIFYSRRNNTGTWAPATPMASPTVGGNTSAGPSLGVLGGSVYAAWKGEWSDPRLFYARYDGTTWKNQIQIPNAYSDVGPALCAFNSTQLIAAWKSIDQSLYYAIYNSSNSKWTEPSKIAGVASSVGPSLAAYNGKLYAVWKGSGTDQSLWYAQYDGTWSGQTKIPGVASSVGASLATVGNKLYAVWKGEGSDQSLWYASYNGTWSSQTQISGVSSSIGAAIAEFGGNLYGMCKGKDADTSLYTAEFSSSGWSNWTNNLPGNTGPDPYTTLTTPAGGNVNYMLADSKGAVLKGTTVTITVVEDIVPDNAGHYSFQINCWSPPQTAPAVPFVWQQYGFRIAANQLFFWVNDFQQQGLPASDLLNWDSRSMPNNTGVVTLPNNTNSLPSGWQLTTTLATDPNSGNVTGFTFSVAQPNGTVLNSGPQKLLGLTSKVVAGNLAPILNMQVILVAENPHDNGPADSFSAGKGILLCYADNDLSAVVHQAESGENSNVKYSPLPASYPNGEFFQFFGASSI
jgi:hypothetical protein